MSLSVSTGDIPSKKPRNKAPLNRTKKGWIFNRDVPITIHKITTRMLNNEKAMSSLTYE